MYSGDRSGESEPYPSLTNAAVGASPKTEDRLWSRAFVDLVISQALFGFAYSVFVLLPKFLAVGYHADAESIGLVMAAFGVVSLAAIPAIGPIVTRIGRRRAMIWASALLGVSAAGFLFISGADLLAACLRGVHGIAWSLLFAAGMSLVADVAPPARLGQAIGLFGGANLAMTALAPAIAEPIAARYGARAVFVLAAAVAIATAWDCRRLPNTVAANGAAAKPQPGTARTRAAALIVLAVGGLAAAGMFTFIAPFALSHDITVVRGFFVAYTVTALALRIGGARLTDRVGHRRTALAGAAGYGLVVILAGIAGPSHLVVLGALFGAAHGVVFPALMALILTGTAPAARPRLLAFTNGAINLGIAGVGLLGMLASRLGYPALFVITGAVTATTALVLVRRSPPRSAASASST
jgi:MFS family permease